MSIIWTKESTVKVYGIQYLFEGASGDVQLDPYVTVLAHTAERAIQLGKTVLHNRANDKGAELLNVQADSVTVITHVDITL